MATKKTQQLKSQPTAGTVGVGSLWLAGVGAVSLARKHGASLLADLVGEGRRLQTQTTRLVRETRTDLRAQVAGLLKPVKARVAKQAQKAGAAVQGRIAGVLSSLGIPSKSDIDDLARRVTTLSRQLKTAK
jgi:poly(hydroxyalkanoate) granule-associated protein